MEIQFETERLILKCLNESDAGILLDYFLRNAEFLQPWEVVRGPSFYTMENMEKLIVDDLQGLKAGHTLRFWILKKEDQGRIIGSVALSNIIRGVFQSAFIGYRLDKEEINKGYMTEAIVKMVAIAFEKLSLHRIEANIIPRNTRSIRTVEKAGFEYEGISKKYLKINGVWEDHVHMVILNEAME
ncbi:GNAT family N-acetyltransferase [Fusibacter sp. JL216-2]|uniref:GNAT family N-acetyltransferase n=1 Tax=Fusibacter sp. JL216-2 TaxID=3071453 RepID=UPI003D334499